MSTLQIRPAQAQDVGTLLRLIKELAAFEREPDAVKTTEADLLRDGFGERPAFEALLAERGSEAVGMALFFPNYSTWEGRQGLYLEDLYVSEGERGLGTGRAILAELAAVCHERGYTRLDLSVLDWNETAYGFYRHLGMREQTDWKGYRLEGEALAQLRA